jgi:hypothetical protein
VIATPANQSVGRLLTQQRSGAGCEAPKMRSMVHSTRKCFLNTHSVLNIFLKRGKLDCDLAEATIPRELRQLGVHHERKDMPVFKHYFLMMAKAFATFFLSWKMSLQGL